MEQLAVDLQALLSFIKLNIEKSVKKPVRYSGGGVIAIVQYASTADVEDGIEVPARLPLDAVITLGLAAGLTSETWRMLVAFMVADASAAVQPPMHGPIRYKNPFYPALLSMVEKCINNGAGLCIDGAVKYKLNFDSPGDLRERLEADLRAVPAQVPLRVGSWSIALAFAMREFGVRYSLIYVAWNPILEEFARNNIITPIMGETSETGG